MPAGEAFLARWRALPKNRREWFVVGLGYAAVFLVLGVLSGFGWNYLAGVLLTILIYAIFALGLSVQFGYAGLLNFGHVLFMALGAYGMAVFGMRYQDALVPHLTGWSVGGALVSLLAGTLAGLVVLVPALLATHRFGQRLSQRARTGVAGGLAAAAGATVLAAMLPLTPEGAENAVTLLGILLGAALAAVAALLLGLPAIRLREDYLAIVTIGAAEILRSVAINEEWLTRGTLGILRLQRPLVEFAQRTPWWRELARALDVRPIALAHLAVALLSVAFLYLLLETLVRSPWGRVLKAIREDEDVAAALGKNVTLYKLQALMLGAAVAAVAGVLLVWNLSNVFPEHFLPIVTFFAFIVLVVGGVGNHKGAILGAAILWGIFELAGQLTFLERYGFRYAGPLQSLFVGLVLVGFMLFRPQGVLGSKEEMRLGK